MSEDSRRSHKERRTSQAGKTNLTPAATQRDQATRANLATSSAVRRRGAATLAEKREKQSVIAFDRTPASKPSGVSSAKASVLTSASQMKTELKWAVKVDVAAIVRWIVFLIAYLN